MSVFKPGHSICRLNNFVVRYVSQYVSQEANELSCTNARIIRFVASNTTHDIYQKDVEKEFGITRSTASRVLMLMEQKGLVERHSVHHDARLKKLVLTEKSQQLSKMMLERSAKLDELLMKGFTDEEKAQLESFIERMTNNINEESI